MQVSITPYVFFALLPYTCGENLLIQLNILIYLTSEKPVNDRVVRREYNRSDLKRKVIERG
jgi:hypothetical protein